MPDPAARDSAARRSRHPVLAVILAALEAAPERECVAFARLFDQWRTWPAERRAVLAKTLCPDLNDAGVAAMAGVSRRHLYRLSSYREFKPRLADFKRSRLRADSSRQCRGFSNPNDPLA